MTGSICVRVGAAVRLPVDAFLASVHLTRDALPDDLRGRLFLTVTQAAKLLDVDPRTLRRALDAADDKPTSLRAVPSTGGRAA